MDIVILDTNVLLVDPEALLSYPETEVILPEIILSELDKIKIARTDADTRFRGRELSRLIFELSDGQSLTDGVSLPNKGLLRIAPFDTDIPMPEGFAAKNPDDRIIVTAQRLTEAEKGKNDKTVTLITNDLNMLLKAQTLGVKIQRHDGGDDSSFTKKYLIRPFQRYKTPLLILAIALAIFAATIVIAVNVSKSNQEAVLPSEYRNFLTEEQANGIDALIMLQSDPKDSESLLTIAKLYYQYYNDAAAEGSANAVSYAKKGVQYYARYLDVAPNDNDARTELATLEFYTGETEAATSDLQTVLSADPDNLKANYTMGIVTMQGNQDYENATTYFEKTVSLCGDDQNYTDIKNSATSYLNQILTETNSLENSSSESVVL